MAYKLPVPFYSIELNTQELNKKLISHNNNVILFYVSLSTQKHRICLSRIIRYLIFFNNIN